MTTVSMFPIAALAALEMALNRLLALDPQTIARLTALQGRVVALEFTGFNLTLYILPALHGIRLASRWQGEPEAVLSGSPVALLAALSGQGLASGQVQIRGDADLAREIQQIFRQLDIDWEEQLSQLTGDVAAHQAGNALRGLLDWARSAGDTLRRDLGEYLQEERRVVPHTAEIETFLAEIDTLRDDVERLAARWRRIEARVEDNR